MADIPGIPVPPNRQPRHKRRVTTTQAWVERGPLVPWMNQYLVWLAEQPTAVLSRPAKPGGTRRGPPTTQERTAKASWFAKRGISKDLVQILERRPDAVIYFERLREDAQFLAKELLRGKITKNLEVRDKGLDMAEEQRDHKAIEHYTRPFVELGFPKKEVQQDTAPRITIHLGSKESKALIAKVLDESEDIQDVSFEVVETKQLESGEDE